ncbi:UTP--glucose-1-phosphate uridylyltransferase GalU [Brevibacillus massiliensis]|uniref:UTP--glucose-1-phosphate uridylyltransferase GalU n=1 Tax=Brevibacillus massiliensis TaxID=1118054 RepID=UPI0002F93C22|nr:UTP--glucose-1-phosphate uridylyltransferase GalU [Brevibacillus massiliensis]
MKVKKAIIPAAGLGTRFLPATKAMPKEMLPIVDKPTIQYIVEEAVASGIEDIIIVTGRTKRSIEDHFDHHFELEQTLREQNKRELLKLVEQVSELADIHYVRQKQTLGLGHAVWCARKFIGEEPFAVLLGDVIIDDNPPCLQQLIDVYQECRGSIIGVKPVSWPETEKFGIIDARPITSSLYAVNGLVEKPSHAPPSNLAIIGRYILEPDIFPILERIPQGAAGEIQLTDALQELLKDRSLYAFQCQGRLYDVGDKLGFLQATVEYALKRDSLHAEFRQFLRRYLQQQTEQ